MKFFLAIFLALLTNDPREIARINRLKKEAEAAFLNGEYQTALNKYLMLSDSLGVKEEAISLNIAHARYRLKDTDAARRGYQKLITSFDKKFRSIAHQQLGVMDKEAGKLEAALQQFKAAIKADPTNQETRYNYEVVKKLLNDREKQDQGEQDQQNKDQQNQGEQDQQDQEQGKQDRQDQEQQGEQEQQNKDQQNQGEQEQQDQEQGKQDQQNKEQQGEQEQQEADQREAEGGEEEGERSKEQMIREQLQEMNMSEEKARMILEAMKNNEIQYLQQQKRKATVRPDRNKPDW